MNQELLTLNLSDLETLIAKSSCSCHFINPNKTRIILWKEEKQGVVTYYLRIGIQKFISYPLTDKNREIYWRFNSFETKLAGSQKEKIEESTINPDPHNPVTKYQQRLAKTKAINHDQSTSTTNRSEQSEPTSH